MPTTAFVANINNLSLSGLTSEIDGSYLNSAIVTVTIIDSDSGMSVPGQAWPLAMNYVTASNGDYLCSLTHELALLNGKAYTAVIDADGSSGETERWGHWEFPFVAQTRTS